MATLKLIGNALECVTLSSGEYAEVIKIDPPRSIREPISFRPPQKIFHRRFEPLLSAGMGNNWRAIRGPVPLRTSSRNRLYRVDETIFIYV